MSEQTKYCKRCDKTQPINRFSKDKKSKDGHGFYCKDCMNQYGREYRARKLNDPYFIYKKLYYRSKKKTKTHGWHWKPLTISLEDFCAWYINEPQQCCYCDMPESMLKRYGAKYGGRYNRFTIECKDNDKGYAKGNLALACDKCNIIKGRTFTFKQMRGIGQEYMKPTWQALE